MKKPLTDQQLESEISHIQTLIANTVHETTPEADRAITRGLRAAFTLGSDQGMAVLFGKAQALIAPQIADEQVKQLGRSVSALIAWAGEGKNRSWHVRTGSAEAGCYAVAWFLDGNGTLQNHFVHDSSNEAEGLSKLATWCAEQSTAAAATQHEASSLGQLQRAGLEMQRGLSRVLDTDSDALGELAGCLEAMAAVARQLATTAETSMEGLFECDNRSRPPEYQRD